MLLEAGERRAISFEIETWASKVSGTPKFSNLDLLAKNPGVNLLSTRRMIRTEESRQGRRGYPHVIA